MTSCNQDISKTITAVNFNLEKKVIVFFRVIALCKFGHGKLDSQKLLTLGASNVDS